MIRYTVYKHYINEDNYQLLLIIFVKDVKLQYNTYEFKQDSLDNYYLIESENVPADIYESWLLALLKVPGCAKATKGNINDRAFYREVDDSSKILDDWRANQFFVDNLS